MAANVARLGCVAVVASVLLCASEASAAFGVANLSFTGVQGLTGTVTYQNSSLTPITTGGIGIGKLNWNVNSTTDPLVAGSTISTFCIELNRILSSPDDFEVGLVKDSPKPSSSSPLPGGVIGAAREALIGRLFDIAYAGLSTNDEFAGFQLAIWELSHETLSTFDVSDGAFKLATGASALAVSKANGWLATAASNAVVPHTLSIYGLSAEDNQDQVFAVPAPPTSGLPEASALTIWGLVMISMGLATNRVRAAA